MLMCASVNSFQFISERRSAGEELEADRKSDLEAIHLRIGADLLGAGGVAPTWHPVTTAASNSDSF